MKQLYYIGGYTERLLFGTGVWMQGQGRGIYAVTLDEDGALALLNLTEGVRNSSALCLSRDKKNLYCVNEFKDERGTTGGRASAFCVNADHTLTLLNTAETFGADPCHISLSPDEGAVYVVNYSSGSLSVFARGADGQLLENPQLIRHSGSGPDRARQEGPHTHSLQLNPQRTLAYVPDLGTDRVYVYRPDGNRLAESGLDPLCLPGGSGPRLISFSADARFAYVICEMSGEVAVFARGEDGYALMQRMPILPADFSGVNTAADLHLTRDGKSLYASNRGHDSIVRLEIAPGGTLKDPVWTPCGGLAPRGFALSDDEKYLLVLNQNSNCLIAMRIDPDGRRLEAVSTLEIGSPVSIAFAGRIE